MNVSQTVPVSQNNENETVTLIALPLQIFQQASQQQSLVVEQNLLFKALPDGTLVIDTNQFLNGNNNVPATVPLQSNSDSNKDVENSEPVILTIQQKNDSNILTNSENINKTNTLPEKEDKNKSKIRYLNNKSVHDIRKAGRPRKDGTKSRTTEKNGPFVCNYCDKEFPRWLLYKRHEKTHINEKKYKCPTCPASFNILTNHLLHVATHNTEDPTCPECGKKFQRIASLKAHLMYHEKEETFYCEDCDISFDNEIEVTEHLKQHGNEKKNDSNSLKCKYCQLAFTTQAEYKKHMSEHNKMRSILQVSSRRKPKKASRIDRKHQCDICQKAFQKRSQIERHMRVHSGEKPYVCKVCNRGFSQKGSLQIHMTRHTGIRPHKCALCSAKFSQKGNLRAHILKTHSVPHGGDNVFSCSECSCVFKRLGSLNCHMTRNHPKQKGCDIKSVMSQLAAMQSSLGVNNDILQQAIIKSELPDVQNQNNNNDSPTATYVTLADLSIDGTMRRFVIKQRRVGDIRWHLCSFCPKEFKKPSDLVRHLRVHTREKPYKCKMCLRSFAVKSTLTTHIRTHTKMKLFECKYCLKFFGSWNILNAHMAKHANQKAHKCSICGKAFKTAALLKHHFQIHLTNEKNSTYYKEPDSDLVMLHPVHITSKGLQSVVPKQKRPITEAGSKLRPYLCVVCGAAFRKLSHLKQHHLRHTGERPFRCHLCCRNFSSSGVLKSHILTHTGKKPYLCVLCKKQFSTNGSLKRHLESHSDVKRFLCPYCCKDFKTIVACRNHIKIHKGQLPQTDQYCLTDSGLIQVKQSNNLLPDLPDTDVSFALVQNTEQQKHQIDEVQTEAPMITQTLRADETGTVVLPVLANQENLTQENMREIEDTLNSQMLSIIGSENFVDTSTYVNKINGSEPIATTDELVNTLSGNTDSLKPVEDNPFLYHHVIVNLQPDPIPEQIPMFNNAGIDNILSQVKLQNDSLFLPELSSLNMTESNNVLLPFQITPQQDLQQNQLIMLPPDIEQEIQSATLNSHLEPIDQNLQLKFNAINGLLQSENLSDSNIVLTSSETDFLHTEEDIVSDSISHISPISGKSIESNILVEEITEDRSTPIIIQTETVMDDAGVNCNLCNVRFESKNDLKLHQCNIFINISDVKVENNHSANSLEANVQFSVPTNEEILTNAVPEKSIDRSNQKAKEPTSTSAPPVHRNQCTYCPKSFRKPSDLQRHIRTHTGERPYKCDECAKSFSLKSTLECHSKIHQGKKEFTCTVCNCLFASKGSLTIHMRLHTGIRPFKCPFCQLKFRTSGHRKTHLGVHYKEAARTGLIPSEIVTRKAKMVQLQDGVENLINMNINSKPNEISSNEQQIIENQSLNIDSGDKPIMQFEIQTNAQGNIVNIKPTAWLDESTKEQVMSTQYEFDEKTRQQIESLLREKKDKEDEARLKGRKVCNICNKEFASKYLLNRHNKIHTGEKTHSCSHCSASFNQKNALEAHIRTHIGSRPYSCPFCSNSFSQSGNLKTHIKRIHNIQIEHTKQTTTASEFNTNDILQASYTTR